jgi:DNA-binding response OmpR family regulator
MRMAGADQPVRILVVEDSKDIAQLLAGHLQRHGFSVDTATNAEAADKAIASSRFSAVLLDRGLPGEDGVSWLRRFRAGGAIMPVIIVSARGGVSHRVEGLAAGADDYVSKPFEMDELVARLRAVLRRSGRLLGDRLAFGNVTLDTRERRLAVHGVVCRCPAREMMALELLLRQSGNVAAKRWLEDQLFGFSADAGPNTMEVYMYRLRKLLAAAGADISVHTIRGVGYLLVRDAPKLVEE